MLYSPVFVIYPPQELRMSELCVHETWSDEVALQAIGLYRSPSSMHFSIHFSNAGEKLERWPVGPGRTGSFSLSASFSGIFDGIFDGLYSSRHFLIHFFIVGPKEGRGRRGSFSSSATLPDSVGFDGLCYSWSWWPWCGSCLTWISAKTTLTPRNRNSIREIILGTVFADSQSKCG